MSEDKTYGQVGYESTNKSEWAWDELAASEQQRQEREAQAAISEFQRREQLYAIKAAAKKAIWIEREIDRHNCGDY